MKARTTMIAAAALLACTGARSVSLFGCDFTDCGSVNPPIGGGSTSGNGSAYTTNGSDGTVGVTSNYRQIAYDYNLETFIEPSYKYSTWRDISCTVVKDRCNLDTLNIVGNKNDVLWVWTLDANMVQNSEGGLRWKSSDWATRFPDRDAALRPPNNDSKERCKANCELVQKKETNLCNLRGSEIGFASWSLAQAGAVYMGTKAGVIATPPTAGVGTFPVGLLVYKQSQDIFVPLADQATQKWTNLCIGYANDRWNDCVTRVCQAFLWLPLLFARRRRGVGDE